MKAKIDTTQSNHLIEISLGPKTGFQISLYDDNEDSKSTKENINQGY